MHILIFAPPLNGVGKMRATSASFAPHSDQIGELRIDTRSRRVRPGGHWVILPPPRHRLLPPAQTHEGRDHGSEKNASSTA
jgi:hypothetical protein